MGQPFTAVSFSTARAAPAAAASCVAGAGGRRGGVRSMRNRTRRVAPAWLGVLCLLPGLAPAACPPAGHTRQDLDALRNGGFAVADDGARQQLALALVDCLGDRSPELRDAIGYEALATWLRADALGPASRRQLLDRLEPQLAQRDADGFVAPFAALVLAELVASDGRTGWIEPPRRGRLVHAAADFLRGVDDYRGLVDGEGWRHGVAHGADLVGQ